ncbi:hypothetical protein SEUCBS140593_003738 [Sporothrix eucalyptigena]|uniref:FAD-binding PCMH-type domain-containing protein n=1 Tax=Sporothrix eucalyptigena TaxID=1812306 RepID=A0ABP0BHA3_9PEZI
MASNTQNTSGPVLQRGTKEYEAAIRNFFNSEPTGRFPAEVHSVRSTLDVANAMERARDLGVPVGVKSGGHLPSKPSLIDNGILIELNNLNRGVEYDPASGVVSFGPAVRVHEAWKATDAVGRFFPFGHAPDVALGGFCLAGGQGFFMRGWGATITDWIIQLEIVVPSGKVVIASRTQNQDLFWAARGGGQAFFGVVTRLWSRTIPKKTLYGRSFVFNVGNNFDTLLNFAFDRNEQMPKSFTETAVCLLHPELFDAKSTDEPIPESSPLQLFIQLTAYADTLPEAKKLLAVWDDVPEMIKSLSVDTKPTAEITWNEFFQLQSFMNPKAPDQNWGIHSILNDPKVPRDKLLEAIKPALCDLPSRSSYGVIYMADTVDLDETDAVFSIPQKYYISTFSGWKNPELRAPIRAAMRQSYAKAFTVACGMYIADFDPSPDTTHPQTMPVWTDSAREKFMRIREKWDPQGIFPGYKAFIH